MKSRVVIKLPHNRTQANILLFIIRLLHQQNPKQKNITFLIQCRDEDKNQIGNQLL